MTQQPDLSPASTAEEPDPRRWLALTVLAVAQLMIILDASIVNVALPSAQDDLGITNANRQWMVTAYTLAFGSLLLIGGRIADYTGRKRTFIIGLMGFAIASAIGGFAQSQAFLFGARGLQGAFAALMAPRRCPSSRSRSPSRTSAPRRSACSARSQAAAPPSV